jgi:CheY-like chemotaxis protein
MAVLIVDDLPTSRRIHRAWLKAGAAWRDDSFVECKSLDEAIAATRRNAVEMVILDLNLDSKDRGVATVKRFLKESGLPAELVYVVTADTSDTGLVQACRDLGVADVSNPGQSPWNTPPKIFTDEQLAELRAQIASAVGAALKPMIVAEFAVLQEEQARRDKLKQAEGILTAMKAVAGAVLFGLGSWILTSAAPVALKAVIASFMTGGKSQ